MYSVRRTEKALEKLRMLFEIAPDGEMKEGSNVDTLPDKLGGLNLLAWCPMDLGPGGPYSDNIIHGKMPIFYDACQKGAVSFVEFAVGKLQLDEEQLLTVMKFTCYIPQRTRFFVEDKTRDDVCSYEMQLTEKFGGLKRWIDEYPDLVRLRTEAKINFRTRPYHWDTRQIEFSAWEELLDDLTARKCKILRVLAEHFCEDSSQRRKMLMSLLRELFTASILRPSLSVSDSRRFWFDRDSKCPEAWKRNIEFQKVLSWRTVTICAMAIFELLVKPGSRLLHKSDDWDGIIESVCTFDPNSRIDHARRYILRIVRLFIKAGATFDSAAARKRHAINSCFHRRWTGDWGDRLDEVCGKKTTA
ncbi:hypothetical protein BJ508DRAFT_304144 [Ascobolus immersus RN42]|uniref:Uncharacterized protein n=1 Tax=Ascobolus immersus RN42 TaxID=1160509 RepID=A0A3N4IH16_ASCIM|nr:hypothetical protein BJ508DRAFT_304144 [Ascobolus immersus RN42]